MRIATSVCVASSPDDVLYPQLHGLDSDKRAATYWRCAAVLLASLRRTNPEAELLLVSDVEVQAAVTPAMSKLLDRLEVTTVRVKFKRFLPPAGASRKFRNNFYKLDVLGHLAELPDGGSALLLDSDVISLRSLDGLSEQCGNGLISYYPYQHSWTDQRSDDLSRILLPLFGDLGSVNYVGGESIGGSAQSLLDLCRTLDVGYQRAVAIAATDRLPTVANGDCIFDNDEFLLSGAIARSSNPVREISDLLRRIHTNTRYFDTRSSDLELTLWHLPGEKVRGFRPVYRAAVDPNSWFWKADDESYRTHVGKLMGVPKRPLQKRLGYAATGLLSRLASLRKWHPAERFHLAGR